LHRLGCPHLSTSAAFFERSGFEPRHNTARDCVELGQKCGFDPLRHLPKGKVAALGLISTKLPEIESADLLKRRIDAAAKFADLGQLCLCPQCVPKIRFGNIGDESLRGRVGI
jgi:methionine synthase II (cobalamin-independent)